MVGLKGRNNNNNNNETEFEKKKGDVLTDCAMRMYSWGLLVSEWEDVGTTRKVGRGRRERKTRVTCPVVFSPAVKY